MMQLFAAIVYLPLTVLALVLCSAAAARTLRGGPVPIRKIVVARFLLIALWGSAILLGTVARMLYQDWVHLSWSAGIPLIGAFLASGVLLSRTSGDENRASAERLRSGAWIFLLMTISLGLLPLVLQIAIPEDNPAPRDVGEPVRRLRELAAWGFGGPLPECLAPTTEEELARGVGHLPREVTVPMGATLIAAWFWLEFCALALLSRGVPAGRRRLAFTLLSPVFLSLLFGLGVGPWLELLWGGFDAGRIWVGRGSGIWTSEPIVLASYGPVLLAALLAALLFGFGSILEHARFRFFLAARVRQETPG